MCGFHDSFLRIDFQKPVRIMVMKFIRLRWIRTGWKRRIFDRSFGPGSTRSLMYVYCVIIERDNGRWSWASCLGLLKKISEAWRLIGTDKTRHTEKRSDTRNKWHTTKNSDTAAQDTAHWCQGISVLIMWKHFLKFVEVHCSKPPGL